MFVLDITWEDKPAIHFEKKLCLERLYLQNKSTAKNVTRDIFCSDQPLLTRDPLGPPCGLSPITHKILEIIIHRFQHLSEHSLCVSSEKIKSKLIWVQKLWRSNWGHVSSIFAGKASMEKILDVVWPFCDVTDKKNKFNGTVFGASWRALSNAVWIFRSELYFRRSEGLLCPLPPPLPSGRVTFQTQSWRGSKQAYFFSFQD